MKFAAVDSITLHYDHEGTRGALPVMFIHSLGCDMRIWDDVIPHLSQQANVFRYDIRGHGLSDCPPAPYTLLELAHDLIGLLDFLDLKKAVLVGSSVGGMIALQTAIAFPQRVTSLVLCDTAARIGTADYWNERINTLRQRGMPYLADTILSRWFAPSFAIQYPVDYRGFHNLLTRTPLEGYIGTCAALRDADLRDAVRQISIPALVLCGAEDAATTPELVRGLANSLPDAHFGLIDGAGHTPSVEQPAVVASAIIQHLQEHSYV